MIEHKAPNPGTSSGHQEASLPGFTAAPLDGIFILDFTELLPGPFLTQSLVEMGATVVKVERPPDGDRLRRAAPAVFASVNRGKTCQTLDLRLTQDRAAVHALIARADVLIEAYRPGVMARHGLDYDALRANYPGLIYLSLTGYGQTGPDAQLPGHDINYLAAAGALALSGSIGTPPQTGAGLPMADLCGSTYGLAALLAALYQRERTGLGQHLDVALTDSVAHWMNARLAPMRAAGLDTSLARREALRRPAYGAFRCGDGRFISLAALEDHFWQRLVDTLTLTPYTDPIYLEGATRRAATVEINASLAAHFSTRDTDQVLTQLKNADVPVMEMIEPDHLANTPQFVARDLYVSTEAGPLCRFPVRLLGMGAGTACDGKRDRACLSEAASDRLGADTGS